MWEYQENLEEIGSNEVEGVLARIMARSLRPVAFGLGILYIVLGFSHLQLLERDIQIPQATLAFASAVILLTISFLLGRSTLQTYYAHGIAAFFAAITIFNSLLHLALSADPRQTTNILIIIIAIGAFFLSWRWFSIILTATVIGWLLIVRSNPDPQNWTHFAYAMGISIVVAALVHNMRLASYQRLVRLRLQFETQKKSLEQANATKNAFLANISHELRTPLNAILGNLEILRERLHGPLNSKQNEILRRIESSAKHQLMMISDLLDVSKVGAGKLPIEFTVVDISQMCRDSVSLVRSTANAKDISVSIEIEAGVETLLADEHRLKQILVNFLSNAIKFTPKGGRVGITVRGWERKDHVRFMVWDTGIGIQEDNKARLFEPFVQLDSGLARLHEGTGLGLALSKQLATLLGGKVRVFSKVGQGSVFVLSLPWHSIKTQ